MRGVWPVCVEYGQYAWSMASMRGVWPVCVEYDQYSIGSINDGIKKLEQDSKILIELYEMNYLKSNPDKWHLLLSEVGNEFNITIGDVCVSNS